VVQQRANEAFSLAVGLRPVGPGPAVAKSSARHDGPHRCTAIAAAVVGQYRPDANGMGGKPRERPLEEPRRRPTIFSAEDLSVAHPGAVVDRDMDVFPAHASRASTAIAMDPMPNEADLAQLLDIEVHE